MLLSSLTLFADDPTPDADDAAEKPTTEEVNHDELAASRERVAAAVKALETGEITAWRSSLESQLHAALIDPKSLNPPLIIDLASQLQIATRIETGQIQLANSKPTLLWLVQQPRLRYILPLSWQEQDDVPNSLEVLATLRDHDSAGAAATAELVTALALVWDQPTRYKRLTRSAGNETPDGEYARMLLDHYVSRRRELAVDPLRHPVRLATLMVDPGISPDEIKWAVDGYGMRQQIGNAFQEIKVDKDHLTYGEKLPLAEQPYTLENIRRYGGYWADQAWFAVQISKSIGIPAAILTSQSPRRAESWVAFLSQQGDHQTWNLQEGREGLASPALARFYDAQTRRLLPASQLTLREQLTRTAHTDQYLAAALLSVFILADTDEQKLNRMALVIRAIELSPGDERVWLALGKLGKTDPVNRRELNALLTIIERHLVPRSPDLAMDVYRDLFAAYLPQERGRLWNTVARSFRGRADLQARVLLEQAAILADAGNQEQSLTLLKQAVQRSQQQPDVLMDAIQQTESLLAPHPAARSALIQIVRDAWIRLPVPERSPYMDQTVWYALGTKQVQLYRDADQEKDAEMIQLRLQNEMRLPERPESRRR